MSRHREEKAVDEPGQGAWNASCLHLNPGRAASGTHPVCCWTHPFCGLCHGCPSKQTEATCLERLEDADGGSGEERAGGEQRQRCMRGPGDRKPSESQLQKDTSAESHWWKSSGTGQAGPRPRGPLTSEGPERDRTAARAAWPCWAPFCTVPSVAGEATITGVAGRGTPLSQVSGRTKEQMH